MDYVLALDAHDRHEILASMAPRRSNSQLTDPRPVVAVLGLADERDRRAGRPWSASPR